MTLKKKPLENILEKMVINKLHFNFLATFTFLLANAFSLDWSEIRPSVRSYYFSGTEEWVHTLKIADRYRAAKRIPIQDPTTKVVLGYVKSIDNFSFYWILDAGHMVR